MQINLIKEILQACGVKNEINYLYYYHYYYYYYHIYNKIRQWANVLE